MNLIKRFVWAASKTAYTYTGTLCGALVSPRVSGYVQTKVISRYPARPIGRARLGSYRALSRTAVDGCVLEGQLPGAWAKFALPKGLPVPGGERRLAIENEPHFVDDFDGVIEAGYGKGTKTLLSNETVMVKIKGKTFASRINYHFHDADVAGPHYDLVVEGLPEGTEKFEIHIPRGEYKGRYAFNTTPKGIVIVPMCDQSVLHEKPAYRLKPESFMADVDAEPGRYAVERKVDGSLGNLRIHKNRGVFRSHRESGQAYYDRLPGLEFLDNKSRLATHRYYFRGPDQQGTVLQGELMHADGASRVSGILNAHPERAQSTQKNRGNVTYQAWDIKALRGRSVEHLPYGERRALLEEVIADIRRYNKHYEIVERAPAGQAQAFYERVVSDPRGLPYSEGVVVKDLADPSGATWFKIKNQDLEDFLIVSMHSSEPGTKYDGSVAWMVVEDPISGHQAKVGSFAVSDFDRQWMYDHRDELTGAMVKVRVMEKTTAGAPRAGTFDSFHPDPRYGKVGTELDLYTYSDSLAGSEGESEAQAMMYRLKSAAGWRR
jgi:hypothetical protein